MYVNSLSSSFIYRITTLSDPSTETVYSLPIMTYLPSEDADIEP
jgi:hypothetical protein